MKISKLIFSVFILLAILSSCSNSRIIINDLNEPEANEIMVFLANNDIKAQKLAGKAPTTGGQNTGLKWNIGVSPQDAIRAMSILTQNGLPRPRGVDLLDLFGKAGLVPSEMEEQIRYQQGLAQQISNTIRKIDGVVDSDVQLSFPKEDPLNPQKTIGKTTASVFVKHQGILDDPNSLLTTKIKRLVTGSVQGLKFDDVTVISDQARFSIVTTSPTLTEQTENQQFVKIWSITLAKTSVKRFRTIFFFFGFIILILLVSLIFILWKVYPIIENIGGFTELLSLHPLKTSKKETKGEEKTEEEEEGEESEEHAEDEEEDEGEEEEDEDNDWLEKNEKT